MSDAQALDQEDANATVSSKTSEDLRNFIHRIERLETEKTAIAEDVKAVLQEAKSDGWDVKTIRKIIKIRKTDERTLQEEEMLLEAYMAALGMVSV